MILPVLFNKDHLLIKYLNRPLKELLKNVLYTISYPAFCKSESYNDWKNSHVFRDPSIRPFHLNWWKMKLFLSYKKRATIARKESENQETIKIALVIHVFYINIFKDIIQGIGPEIKSDIKLYITTVEQHFEEVKDILEETRKEYVIKVYENRGRDVLPFIKILPEIINDNRNIILKLHTKGSNHLSRKNLWKNDLYNKLILNGNMQRNIDLFKQYPFLGMLAPQGHILPMSFYYGSNAGNLFRLCNQLGISRKQVQGLVFVAGSMFYARTEVVRPILNLNLSDEDFEPENGQLDGTMSHAIERLFTVFLPQSGYILADTRATVSPDFTYHVIVNHSYTV